jgi:hypothetical protein
MEKCIRYADGRQITSADYTAIKKHALHLIRTILNPKNLPKPKDPKAKTMAKSKLYYKEFHYNVYSTAIAKLEENFPILALCSSSWKADHVLAASLSSSSAGEKTRLRQAIGVDEESDGNFADPSHKRSREDDETPLTKKKPRSDLHSTNSDKNTSDPEEPTTSKIGRKKGRHPGSTPRKGKSKPKEANPILPVPQTATRPTAIGPTAGSVVGGAAISPLTYIDVGFIEVDPTRKFFFFIFIVSKSNVNQL